MASSNVNQTRFRNAFVLFLVLAVSLLFLAVAWPFLKPLLIGALLAGLCDPLYRSLSGLLRGHKSAAAGLTLLILFVVVVGPLSAFIGVVVQQAITVSNDALPWVRSISVRPPLSMRMTGSCAVSRHSPITCRSRSRLPTVPPMSPKPPAPIWSRAQRKSPQALQLSCSICSYALLDVFLPA